MSLQKIQRIDFQSPNAPQEFVKSLRETGFAVFYNHPIPEASITTLYKRWEEEFFTQPTSEKEPFHVDPKTQFGWVPPTLAEMAKGNPIRDIKEFYNFYYNGTCPKHLREFTAKTFNELFAVGHTLLTWIENNTPDEVKALFSEPVMQMVENSPKHLFRINYYPALTGVEEQGAVRAAAHTDIDLITVLTAGTTDGLQAQTVDGEWINVPCEHGNLVINAGDMLQEASGGYYPSTVHRVLNPKGDAAKKPRMSCPLFLHPREEVRLSKRHTAESYLHERLVELGLRTEERMG